MLQNGGCFDEIDQFFDILWLFCSKLANFGENYDLYHHFKRKNMHLIGKYHPQIARKDHDSDMNVSCCKVFKNQHDHPRLKSGLFFYILPEKNPVYRERKI